MWFLWLVGQALAGEQERTEPLRLEDLEAEEELRRLEMSEAARLEAIERLKNLIESV
jgi:hypothetical protein